MTRLPLICGLALLFGTSAMAADPPNGGRPWYYDHYNVSGLLNFYTLNTKASLVPKDTPADNIDLEAKLGLNDNITMGTLAFDWRPSIKERWSFDLFTMGRNGKRVIDEEIIWGDETFPINATIKSKETTSTLRATYHYSLYHDLKTEAGLGLGVYVMRVYMSLGVEGGESKAESTTITAPLPVIAVFGQTEFAPKWTVGGEFDWFDVSVNGVNGRVLNLNANVGYLLSERWDLKLGWETFSVDVTGSSKHLSASAETGFSGLYFGAGYRWN
jgi:hypothetical protein